MFYLFGWNLLLFIVYVGGFVCLLRCVVVSCFVWLCKLCLFVNGGLFVACVMFTFVILLVFVGLDIGLTFWFVLDAYFVRIVVLWLFVRFVLCFLRVFLNICCVVGCVQCLAVELTFTFVSLMDLFLISGWCAGWCGWVVGFLFMLLIDNVANLFCFSNKDCFAYVYSVSLCVEDSFGVRLFCLDFSFDCYLDGYCFRIVFVHKLFAWVVLFTLMGFAKCGV